MVEKRKGEGEEGEVYFTKVHGFHSFRT